MAVLNWWGDGSRGKHVHFLSAIMHLGMRLNVNFLPKYACFDFVTMSVLLLAYFNMINIELVCFIAIFHWPMV